MKTIRCGDIAKLAVASALAKAGERVLFPFSEAERYDIALDREGKLYRIQCKNGRYRNGAVVFNACSVGPRMTKRNYHGDADAFGVYCQELDRCFLVPVSAVGKAEARLRIIPPAKRNQKFTPAIDFEI